MALVAELEITCDRLPLVAVAAAAPAATIDVEMVPSEDRRTPFVAHVDRETGPAVERAFESSTFVGEYALVGETGDRRRYKIRPGVGLEEQLGDAVDDLDGLAALAATDSVVDRIRVTPTGWIQSGWFADRSVFDEFRAFWQAEGNGDGFSLRRLTRRGGDRRAARDAADGLTPPQREAMVTAHEMGYFEISRTASLDDVAAELGVSAASCSERLRRAQDRLVETCVRGDVRSRDGRVAGSRT